MPLVRSARFLRAFPLVAALVFITSAGAATTSEFRVLLDTDHNAGTGCTVDGMAGVEQTVITNISTEGITGTVNSVRRLLCGGVLTDVSPGGWNVAVPGRNDSVIVETFMPYSVFGGTLPTGMRLGFVFRSGASSASAFAFQGRAIVYPDPHPARARIAGAPGSRREITLDGRKPDWGGILPAFESVADPLSLRMTMRSVHVWGNGTFLYLKMEGSARPVEAPIANDDAYTADEESPLVVGPRGVLENDVDGDGNPLPVAGVTANQDYSTTNGSIALNSDGSFTYAPNPNFDGTDSFSYHVNDDHGLDSNTVTATIAVSGVNDAPVNTVPAGATTAEDTALAFTGANAIAVADIDANPDAIHLTLNVTSGTLTVSSAPPGTTGNGTASITMTATVAALNAALSDLTFHPAFDFSGSATVTMTTSDAGHNGSGGTLTDTDDVPIAITTVNDPPTANGDPVTTAEDIPLSLAAATLTANDTPGPANESAQTLSVTAISPASANGGTVTLVAGTITYTPAANFNGIDTFTYSVADNGAPAQSANGTVTVTVTEVNDAPAATSDAMTTAEDTPSTFAASTLTTNDSRGPNESAQTLTVSGVSPASAQGGTVVLVAGNITYTAPANHFGADSFTYTVADSGTTSGVPAPLTASGTVNVTVTAVNDAPVLTLTGAGTHTEGGAATSTGTAANIVDVDDTNIESATIRITGFFASGQDVLSFANTPNITGSFVDDTITLTGSDTKANYIAALLAVQYLTASNTPLTEQRTISWSVNDGSANSNTQTTTLDVTATNDAPVNSLPAAQITNEDVSIAFSASGGNSISISDADANPDDVRITLTVTNGIFFLHPIAKNGLTSFSGNGTSTVVATGFVGQINAALESSFIPTSNYSGTASIQVVTEDLGNNPGDPLTDTDTLSITVVAVIEAPVLSVTGAVTYTEGAAAMNLATAADIADDDDTNIESATIRIIANFASDQDVLSFTNTPNITGSLAGDTLTLTGSDTKTGYVAALLSVTYSNSSENPSPAQRTLSWTVNDGDIDGSTQTTLDVTAINDAPVNSLPAEQSTNEDIPLVLSTANGNAISIIDADGDPDDVQVTLTGTLGGVALNAGATGALTQLSGNTSSIVVAKGTVAEINAALDGLTFTPHLNSSGAASLQVATDDLGHNPGGNLTDTDTLAITVNDINDPPVNNVPGDQIAEEDTFPFFSMSISDAESLTAEVQLSVTSGRLYLNSTSGLTFTAGSGNFDPTMTFSGTIANINAALDPVTYEQPLVNTNGAQTVTIVTSDLGNAGPGGVQSDTDTILLNITPVNDSPSLSPPLSLPTMYLDSVLTMTGAETMQVFDIDAGTNPVQVSFAVSGAPGGTFTLDGTAGLSFIAGDGSDDSSMTFTGTLSAINDAFDGMTYTPSPGVFGTATVAGTVNDLGSTGTGGALQGNINFDILVNQGNRPPQNGGSFGLDQTIAEGGTHSFVFVNNTGVFVEDPDAGGATVQVQLSVTIGTLTLNSIVGLAFTGGDGTADAVMTFTGTMININTALEGMTFTGGPGVSGTSTFTMTTNDLGNTGPGGPLQDTDTITIHITPAP